MICPIRFLVHTSSKSTELFLSLGGCIRRRKGFSRTLSRAAVPAATRHVRGIGRRSTLCMNARTWQRDALRWHARRDNGIAHHAVLRAVYEGGGVMQTPMECPPADAMCSDPGLGYLEA